MSITLRIERLVIDEAALGEERGADVRATIERDLARQLAQPGALAALRGLGAMSMLPPVVLPPSARPHERLGSRIAMAVGQGLGVASGPPGKGVPTHG